MMTRNRKLPTHREQLEHDPRHKREEGIALMLSVILMFILATLAMASLDTAMRDAQISGSRKASSKAFQMAEAGVADALDFLYNRYDPVNIPEIGTTIDVDQHGGFGGSIAPDGSFETTGGSYDLAPGTNITMVAKGEPCLTADPAHFYAVWDITIQGVNDGTGSSSTIEFSALVCQCMAANCP